MRAVLWSLLFAVCIAGPAWAQGGAAAPQEPAAAERASVLVMELHAAGVAEGEAHTIDELVTTAFSKQRGIKVLSMRELRDAVRLEGEKQIAACDEETESCLAEIAGALGARFVVSGSVGRLGTLYLVNLGLYDSQRAESVVREKIEAHRLEHLPQKIDATVALMAARISGQPPAPAPEAAATERGERGDAPEQTEGGTRPLLWTGLILGGVGAVAGIGLGALALYQDAVVATPDATGKDGARSVGQIATFAAAGGGVLALAGAGLALFGALE